MVRDVRDASGTVPSVDQARRTSTALTPARDTRSQRHGCAQSVVPRQKPTAILLRCVIVGPESDEWTSTVWQYEQFAFSRLA